MRTISQMLLSFLLNASWQILLIAGLASICSWLLKKAAARQRHLVWVAALALSITLPWFSGSGILLRPTFSAAAIEAPPALSLEAEPLKENPASFQKTPTTGDSRSWLSLSQKLATVFLLLYLLLLFYRAN